MNFVLNVNTNQVIAFSNKLEKMRKVEIPIAVRGALNKAAFHVKQVTMPGVTDSTFTKRKENFFKANSKVVMASGLDLRSMRSIVGFTPHTAKYNNQAVEELHQQEHGGSINKREIIPTDESRIGGNATAVRPKNRVNTIRGKLGKNILANAVHANRQTGPNRRFKYIKAAIKAGKGGYVVAGLRKPMLYRINSIARKYGRTFVKSSAIYSINPSASVSIQRTGFMRKASLQSANRLEQFYIEEAMRRFAKMAKR